MKKKFLTLNEKERIFLKNYSRQYLHRFKDILYYLYLCEKLTKH